MRKIKLTTTTVDLIPFADKGKQVDYWDTELTGFGCRTSACSKTYIVMKRVNGRQKRISLGKHGAIEADQARAKAISTLSQLNNGIDVSREKARDGARSNTLDEAFGLYLESKPLMKPHSIRVDRSLLKCHLSDWKNTPIKGITREMVAKRHTKIANDSGEVTANNAMRLVRRIINFTQSISNGDPAPNPVPNPVLQLSDSKQWFKVEKRQTVLKKPLIPIWYSAVQQINNQTIKDYLLLLLFTGLRKNEAIKLEWKDVNFKYKEFSIQNSMGSTILTLPMSDFLVELFKRRLALKVNKYVFPGTGKDGHLIEPKRQVKVIENETQKAVNGITDDEEFEKRLKEAPKSLKPGVTFCLHDLRRTFVGIAESLVPYSALKRLLNYTSKEVTQEYIVFNVDKLRVPMQTVTNEICRLAIVDLNISNKRIAAKKKEATHQGQLPLLF